MVTMKDIAKLTGVSVATVSFVVNNKPGVSEPTKRKVQEVIDRLGYMPSASAQALKTNHSRSLAMIVGQLSNAYHIDVITTAEEEARKYGYELFICNAEFRWDRVVEQIRSLRSRSVDGVMLSISVFPDEPSISSILEIWRGGLPMISLSSSTEAFPIPIVSFDMTEQIEQAVRRLFVLGHRQVGMVAAPEGSWSNYRLDCFQRVAREFGAFDQSRVVYAPHDIYSAQESIRGLLTAHPEITALYTVNDMMALSTLQVADQLGIAVPEQLSLLGSDGIPYINFTKPRLSTVQAPLKEVSKRATRQLIRMIEDRTLNEEERVCLPCTFSQGGSIAPPPQHTHRS